MPTLDPEAVPPSRTPKRREYGQEQRIEAVGLAMSIGVKAAGRKLNIPYRTISHWMTRPDVKGVVAASRDELLGRLWEAVRVGTEQVLSGLRDPRARLSDKAQALRVVAEQYQLLAGEATSRIETANVNYDPTWTPPTGAEPVLTASEQRLLERYLEGLEHGTAVVVIDSDYRQLEAGEDDDVG